MTASSETVHGRIKRVIVDSLKLEGLAPEEIGNDQALFGEGLGLDSVDALELVLGLEQEFAIKIKGDQMDRDAFACVDSLAAWVEGHRQQAEANATES
jgi:acyl carrier protein